MIARWLICIRTGALVGVPAYIPDEWLDRIVAETDETGRAHLLWVGWNNGKGHAKVSRDGKMIYCHRDVVERVEGRKLSRFEYVDHRCEKKACLTYACLEGVTPGENTRRGPGAQHQFKRAAGEPGGYAPCATWQEPLEALDALQ